MNTTLRLFIIQLLQNTWFFSRQGCSCTDIGSIIRWKNPSGVLLLHTVLEDLLSTKSSLSADPSRVAQTIYSLWDLNRMAKAILFKAEVE